MHVDFTREVGDEAGALAVAGKPRILGDRVLGLCRGLEVAEGQGRKRKQARAARRHDRTLTAYPSLRNQRIAPRRLSHVGARTGRIPQNMAGTGQS